jgi:anti-sigma factor RsiW
MSEQSLSPGCEAITPELNAYVDGELRPAQRSAVEHHLEDCAACRAEVELLRLVTRSLRQVPLLEPSDAMRHRLLARVTAERLLGRVTTVSIERHGDQLLQCYRVRLAPEPDLFRREASLGRPRPRLAVRQCRQQFTTVSNGYQTIESVYWEEQP